MEFVKLSPRTEGVVHDIAFDYYGKLYYVLHYIFI